MKAGWERTTLRDLCIVDWGNTSLTKAAYIETGDFLAVSATGCDGRIGHKEHSKGTPVLSAIGAQCGKMFFPREDFTAIKNTITLTPKSGKCTGRFLYHLLTSVQLPQRGAGQPFISKGDIEGFSVTVPASLNEQHRIACILDKAFGAIETAKANAEKNLQNARALMRSALESALSPQGTGWLRTTIGGQVNLQRGFDITKNQQKRGRVPVVSSGGIKSFQQNVRWAIKRHGSRNAVSLNRDGRVLFKVSYL